MNKINLLFLASISVSFLYSNSIQISLDKMIGVSNSKKIIKKHKKNHIHKKDNVYENNIQIYEIGENINDNNYHKTGLKINLQKTRIKLEKGKNAEKYTAIFKQKIKNNYYLKIGGGYSKLKNFKEVSKKEVNPEQSVYGIEIGRQNDNNLYISLGEVRYHSSTEDKSGNSWITYMELVKRLKSKIGKFDISGNFSKKHLVKDKKNAAKIVVEYYPTDNLQIGTIWNTSADYKDNDYKIKLGLEYIFKNKKFIPYIAANYNLSKKHTQIEFKYENGIVKLPISWKDEFEKNIEKEPLIIAESSSSKNDTKNDNTSSSNNSNSSTNSSNNSNNNSNSSNDPNNNSDTSTNNLNTTL